MKWDVNNVRNCLQNVADRDLRLFFEVENAFHAPLDFHLVLNRAL